MRCQATPRSAALALAWSKPSKGAWEDMMRSTFVAAAFVFAGALPSFAGTTQMLFCGCEEPYCTPMGGGGHYCTAGDELCCDENSQFRCTNDAPSCGGIPLYCAGTSDCTSGQMCCALPDPDAFVSTAICQDYCGSSSEDPEGFRLCTSDDDCVDLGMPCKLSSGLA